MTHFSFSFNFDIPHFFVLYTNIHYRNTKKLLEERIKKDLSVLIDLFTLNIQFIFSNYSHSTVE